jgi:hypothetical protein
MITRADSVSLPAQNPLYYMVQTQVFPDVISVRVIEHATIPIYQMYVATLANA